MRTSLSRGICLALLLIILSCLSACESPEESCRRACGDVDLDFHAYVSPVTNGDIATPGICQCQKDDGDLVKLW